MEDIHYPDHFDAPMRTLVDQLIREVTAARSAVLYSDKLLIIGAVDQQRAAADAFEQAAMLRSIGMDDDALEISRKASALVRDVRATLTAIGLSGERRGKLARARTAEAMNANSDYALTNKEMKGQVDWSDLLQ